MRARLCILLLFSLLVSACVQVPVYKKDGYALVKSSHAMVNLNGVDMGPTYRIDIKEGQNTLVVIYPSYRYKYRCTFVWRAAAETAYEITDQEKQYPLTLYRWVRRNALWAVRLDPVDPERCDRQG